MNKNFRFGRQHKRYVCQVSGGEEGREEEREGERRRRGGGKARNDGGRRKGERGLGRKVLIADIVIGGRRKTKTCQVVGIVCEGNHDDDNDEKCDGEKEGEEEDEKEEEDERLGTGRYCR